MINDHNTILYVSELCATSGEDSDTDDMQKNDKKEGVHLVAHFSAVL